jgi:hypothetical protein
MGAALFLSARSHPKCARDTRRWLYHVCRHGREGNHASGTGDAAAGDEFSNGVGWQPSAAEKKNHEAIRVLDLIVAIVLAIVFALGFLRWLSNETITTYWTYTGSGYPAARETYSVNRASATVNALEQWQGNFVSPHKDCAIFDARNWSCAGAELWATDGKVREAILSTDPRLREVSWFRWWLARLTHWGQPPEDAAK